MNRLRLFILLFFIMVSLPLGFVIWRSYSGLEQEERAQLLYFSETLFDQMERELADLIQREENRAVDEYQYFLAGAEDKGFANPRVSPLAGTLSPDYILGYLQNNPDGSFQTPMVADMGNVPEEQRGLVTQLREANRIFNSKKFSIAKKKALPSAAASEPVEYKEQKDIFSERFLSRKKSAPVKTYLGKKTRRIEEITAEQAYNIATEDVSPPQRKDDVGQSMMPATASDQISMGAVAEEKREDNEIGVSIYEQEASLADQNRQRENQQRFQVEVAPFQSVAIKADQVYIFRRIAINNQIYRQGFLIQVQPLLRHLIASHFEEQPLARFSSLQLQRRDQGDSTEYVRAGAAVAHSEFLAERDFPPPFDFLHISLRANGMPSSPARSSLHMALGVLALFMTLGLLAIYQSARAIFLMSERRTQFVSSVTHELKTPLTNIRMYVEMLEQGVAATPEREQEYLNILGSESSRLAGLINNVLDMAKLEKKQNNFHMREGRLDEVLDEVETIMSQKLKQDGFILSINTSELSVFQFDRDVVIQILMNLIENSVKFGKHSPERKITINVSEERGYVRIAVSDTGPGIPKRALRKIFDDFYRVNNELTRTTGGTGIGLALVKKFVLAMGGRVFASNNKAAGCTITLLLPKNKMIDNTEG